jgi:RNA polymerase sigma factor for flagellar operon FliA
VYRDDPRDPHVVKAMSPDELVEEYRPLMLSIVSRVRIEVGSEAGSEDDLVSYAVEGLLDAQQRFDPDFGNLFVTYAYYRVRGAVIDGCRKGSWNARHNRRALMRALDAHFEATAERERGSAAVASFADAADRLGELVDGAVTVTLLATADLEPMLAAPPSQEQTLLSQETRGRVADAFEDLEDVEREIVVRYWFEGQTFREIAHHFDRSPSWTSRAHARALEKLRKRLQQPEKPARSRDKG